MGNTLGYKASHFIRMCTGLPTYQYSAIVGILLGDGNVSITQGAKSIITARISIAQSMAHIEYIWFVWQILSPYCQSFPYLNRHKFKGKTFYSIVLKTRTYAVFSTIYKHFISITGVKQVPIDIYHLLNEIGFAHWIMCDGSRLKNGALILCTDSFSIQDVVKLMNVLNIK
jgi:hypothetical protein